VYSPSLPDVHVHRLQATDREEKYFLIHMHMNLNKREQMYPIARWANPATVPGMRAGGSMYECLKLYINLLKVLESCKVLR